MENISQFACKITYSYVPTMFQQYGTWFRVVVEYFSIAASWSEVDILCQPSPAQPPSDHIEGAHPLLGGEIRFLLFWLAPPSPGLHFTTTGCY